MTHYEELAHTANAYHAAPESEKAEHAQRIEAVLEKFSMMDLARYILAGARGKVSAARHSESLTLDEARAAARHASEAEAKTFFEKVQQEQKRAVTRKLVDGGSSLVCFLRIQG